MTCFVGIGHSDYLQVELKDISADVFEIIVRYTYDVKGPQSDEITMDLIKAVDMCVFFSKIFLNCFLALN